MVDPVGTCASRPVFRQTIRKYGTTPVTVLILPIRIAKKYGYIPKDFHTSYSSVIGG